MSQRIKCVVSCSNKWVVKKWSFPNAKFIFIIFESFDKTCFKTEKTWFLLAGWQKSIKYYECMKNTEAAIRFSQWCNLKLAPRFWTTKVCLQASKISKICLFGHPTGQATSWKANFEICSRYSLIKWNEFLSI